MTTSSKLKLILAILFVATTVMAGVKPANERLIVEQLTMQLGIRDIYHEVSLRRGVEHFTDSQIESADSIKLTSLTESAPRGLYPFLIEIYTPSGSHRSQATAYVAVYDSVLVFDGAYSRGQTTEKMSVKRQWTDVTRSYENPITNKAELDGMRLRRGARLGQIVTQEALEVIPAVNFGDRVTITFANRNLTLTVEGKALEDGAVGERIRIRNSSNNSIVQATVTGAHQATIIGG